MGSKKRILIIHPEGNIVNNPNLFAIAQFLSDYYLVDVLMPKNNIPIPKNIKFKIIHYSNFLNRLKHEINNYYLYKYLYLFYSISLNGHYNFIFGVDRIGIIDTYFLAQKFRCNYALISYEIFFEDETSKNFKQLERTCCKNITFAIVQDELRGRFLSSENLISEDKMIYIPVAGDGKIFNQEKKYKLHEQYGLDKNSKILIFIGSVSDFNCLDKFMYNIDNYLPDDWYFLIHDRYGQTEDRIKKICTNKEGFDKLIIMKNKIYTFDQLQELLNDADLGFVGYCPNYKTPHTGKNIEHIGMSSGKFSTYMQNGLPVIVYNSKDLALVVKENSLGFYISKPDELKNILVNFTSREQYKNNCHKFYESKLNFKNYKAVLMEAMENN